MCCYVPAVCVEEPRVLVTEEAVVEEAPGLPDQSSPELLGETSVPERLVGGAVLDDGSEMSLLSVGSATGSPSPDTETLTVEVFRGEGGSFGFAVAVSLCLCV